jgi:acyl carrier protein
VNGSKEENMVYDKIREFLAEQLDIDPETIGRETNIVDDLGADSLDVVEVMMALEDEFSISIPDEAIAELKTVDEAVEYIESLI